MLKEMVNQMAIPTDQTPDIDHFNSCVSSRYFDMKIIYLLVSKRA